MNRIERIIIFLCLCLYICEFTLGDDVRSPSLFSSCRQATMQAAKTPRGSQRSPAGSLSTASM